MKYVTILLSLFLALPSHSSAQTATDSLNGIWLGQLGGKLRLVFHFTPTADNKIEGTMDSPDQGTTDLPIQSISIQQDSLLCSLNTPKAHYTGKRTNDSTLNGYWYQSVMRIPLTLHRLSATEALAYAPSPRPQTPQPPYPYHSDSVEYDNTSKTVHLGATLTYPSKGGPFPAAILITGSGTQDRDETIFRHKPFAVIADYLTRHGYAVLRVDDRGAGLSKGDRDSATTDDFAKDVETSLAWLKQQKMINPKKIGLIGHSEGAAICDIVASRNKDVAFIISMAGPLSGYSTMMYQRLKPLVDANVDPNHLAYEQAKQRILLNAILNANTAKDFAQQVETSYQKYYDSIPDSARAQSTFIVTPDSYNSAIKDLAPSIFHPWWKFLISYRADSYYTKVKCPVLLLGGAQDIQVPNTTDMDSIATILKNSGNPHVQTRLFPGLNHLFQHCKDCSFGEYSKLEETFAPEALTTLSDWLDKTIKR